MGFALHTSTFGILVRQMSCVCKFYSEIGLVSTKHPSTRLMITCSFRKSVCLVVSSALHLTHWGRDKMAANFPDDIFKLIFSNENVGIPLKKIHWSLFHRVQLKWVSIGSDNGWRRLGDKPLSEPVMVQLTEAFMRRTASMSSALPTTPSTTTYINPLFININAMLSQLTFNPRQS